MPRIFHYTNLESLALILKSRTIRFTRLDQVDDVSEAQTHAGISFGKQIFVSCWTKDEAESIPQWYMYSSGMAGVRLEFPEYPFRSLKFEVPASQPDIRVVDITNAPLSFEESLGQNYFVIPNYFDANFAGDVEYVLDPAGEYRNAVVDETLPEVGRRVTVHNGAWLARLKSVQWSFQKEYRFTLNIIPRSKDRTIPLGSLLLQGVDPGLKFFDVPFDPGILDNISVRTGPLCTAGTKACTEAILAKWAPLANIESSSLSIRKR